MEETGGETGDVAEFLNYSARAGPKGAVHGKLKETASLVVRQTKAGRTGDVA